MKFPNRVREVRNEKGYSREQLAQLIGVTRQSIGLIEAGRICPSTAIALRISRVLGLSVEELFFGEDTSIFVKFVANEIENEDRPIRAYLSSIRGDIIARPASIETAGSINVPVHGIAHDVQGQQALSEVCLLQNMESIAKTVFISGCDMGLGLLANYIPKISFGYQGVWFNVSNHRALKEFADGITHIAAVHYSALETENFLQKISFPFRKYHFATSELGWILPKRNPKGFQGVEDLGIGCYQLINREDGAGARELLDKELRRVGLNHERVAGYSCMVKGHISVADAVAKGIADVGVGHAGAAAMLGLSFIPIQEEMCTLLIPEEYMELETVQVLLETLNYGIFHTELRSFGPYDVNHTGMNRE